jgi:4-amino-4-deoxy-L-arabinose transferase-like glycosyltransferase
MSRLIMSPIKLGSSLENKGKFAINYRTELILFFLLVALALIIRVNQLSADPPVKLSTSQDVYTDPAQYTSYARNLVLYGSFNPLHDYRLVFFLKSITNVAAWLVFSIFGVGYWQGNMVGLLFSFPTIMLLYFIVRKIAGNIAALFSLALIAVDYNQIFYGRLSFLENSMNFFGILSFTLLLYGRRCWVIILAGMSLAAGTFFGKLLGLIYIFPFICYAVYEYFHGYDRDFKKIIVRYGSYVAGYLAVFVFWYFFSYRPLVSSVSGYVEEQAFNLYGIPEAFTSVWIFIYRYVSLGVKSAFFERMPVAALLCWGMILTILYRIGRKENWKSQLNGLNPGIIFLAALVIGAYGSLMVWNYRPLRYQTMMIYPIYGLAGIFLSLLVQGKIFSKDMKGYKLFPFVLLIFIMIPLYQLIRPRFDLSEASFFTTAEKYYFLAAVAVLTLIIVGLWKIIGTKFYELPAKFRNGFLIAAMLGAILPNSINYLNWSSVATFTTIANSKDLARILSPEAVVSGPYAASLTQENMFFNLIHMFGVAKVDTVFFQRYPITHILVDKSNEESAKENYSEILDKAPLVAHYYVGNRNINLYRVAGLTGNIVAREYQMSDFELALNYYLSNHPDTGNIFMKRFLLKNPDNLAGNFIAGNMATEIGLYGEAEYFFKKAISNSPTDFHLRYKLGEFYIILYRSNHNADFMEKGRRELELARKLNPTSSLLSENIDALLAGKEFKPVE